MFQRLVLAAFLVVAGGTANSAEPTSSGVYFGGSYGASVFDDDGTFAGFDFDDQDRSVQAHVGYKFLPYLAVEGRYTNYGTFTLETLDFDVTAVSAHAVGILPFGSSGWEIFGQIGLGSLSVDFGGTDDSQSTVAAGIGVRYYATENLSIGVQADVHVWEDSSLGTSQIPNVGSNQVSIQFAF